MANFELRMHIKPPSVKPEALAIASKRIGDSDPDVQMLASELLAISRAIQELPRQIEEAAIQAGAVRQ